MRVAPTPAVPPPPPAPQARTEVALPVAELDRGFIRPTYEAQVIVSYMQAGLICEYIAGRFGLTPDELNLDLGPLGKLI